MGFFRNIVDKFKQGLQKTREAVVTGVQGLRNILTGRKLDEELINEIERRLLQADVGVKTTAKLIDGLRADFRSGTMENGDQALEYLKREIAEADSRKAAVLARAGSVASAGPRRRAAFGDPHDGRQRCGQDHQHRQAVCAASQGEQDRAAWRV